MVDKKIKVDAHDSSGNVYVELENNHLTGKIKGDEIFLFNGVTRRMKAFNKEDNPQKAISWLIWNDIPFEKEGDYLIINKNYFNFN